jgi:hypothetical protein
MRSPTDKTRLEYVAPPSDIPSTSRTVFVKPTVPEPPPTVVDKGKDIINGDVPITQKLPTIRRSPICHHCGLSEHVRPQCSLLKAPRAKVKKEMPRQANFGTRPLAQYQNPWNQASRHQTPWKQAPRHWAPQYQAPWHHSPRRQAPQHQRPLQRFVPANQGGKPKTNKSRHLKRPQKKEDDQCCKELPIWMQSMMQWMDHQIKSCQQPPTRRQAWVRKKQNIHPLRGNGLT